MANPPTLAADTPADLAAAITAAAAAPERAELWDEAEKLASDHQRPEDVADLYRAVLEGELPKDLALELCERAVGFMGDWFEESDRARAVLLRALDVDPTTEWAFRRLTMQLTVDRKWDDLLALYDRVIAATGEAGRRVELTTEAAQIAKDLAGRADRAIAYLEALSLLSPGDAQTSASLERLLDREGRHRELVELWRARLGELDRAAAMARRAQIAGCLLDRLGSPAEALDEVGTLLADPASLATAIALLERIFAFPTAGADVRGLALDELKRHYEGAGRVGEIIRLLGAALDRAEPGEKAELHRDIAGRLASEGREVEALDHYAALIALDPASDAARARLREVAEHTGKLDRYADALVRAADACGEAQAARAIALLLEAATVRCDALGDAGAAATIYARIFAADGVDDAAMLEVSRRLDDLYARAGKDAERLHVLERRAGLEDTADARRALRAEAARLADALGQADRALAAWGLVLDEAPSDREAHEAIVALLEREARWDELILALERSADAKGSGAAERQHRVRAARVRAERLGAVAAAIEAWRAIEERFGSNEETVDALAALLESAGRWAELAAALEQGLRDAEDPERRLSIEQRLGDLYRTRSGEPERALARYREVLAARPDHEGARIGLYELLAEPACRAEATRLLLQAFEATGDWAGRLSLLEHRLAAAADDAARTALLCEAADLHEQRGGDARSALVALARALPLAPDDVAIEARLLGLAEASGGWDVAARALGEAVEACAPGPRAAELHHRHGLVLEERLGDMPRALAAYLAALALAPSVLDVASAVLRAATAEGRWDVAARALVDVAHARGALDPGLREAVEIAADARSAWDAIAAELGAALTRDTALAPALVAEIARTVALWHRDRRSDPEAAEETLLRSLTRGAGGLETLEMLAGVQRRAPGRPLVDTLIRVADELHAEGGERVLAALREAADVAVTVLHEEVLSRSILERLLAEVSARLDSGEGGLDELADHAIGGLVSLASARDDHERAVAILVSAAKLPLGLEASRARLHEAAAIAEERLGDGGRAVALYRAILEGTPGDALALARLSAIFAGQGSVADLLALRRHELALAPGKDARVALRLSIAELLGRVGDAPARLATLRENLADEPGHARSLEELAALLAADAQHGQLASVLEAQAGELEALGDGARAAELWTRASEIAETELHDASRALADRIRVVEAMPTAETFDALARLSTAQGDHAAAVGWLDRRLQALDAAGPDGDAAARIATLARLAGAHVGAGHPEVARARLESGLRDHPGAEALRAPLRDLYRAAGAWDLLVDLLTSPGEGAPRIDHLREAADICVKRLGSRDRAIPILDAMVALAPTDRVARLALAGALRGAGQLDRARAVLTSVLDEYGRRRPPERAEVHFQLAQVAAAAGQAADARAQLETATSMSTEHPGALRMLASLYRDAGDLERAERMYGALLLIALRQRPGAEEDPDRPARSEVMVNLHWILARLQQTGRADEMLASAFEAARRSEFEAERLEHTLREAGDHALLLRALDARLERGVEGAAARAAVLSDMADVLGGPLERPEDAFGRLLSALEIDPGSPILCERAAAMARRAGATRRWAEVLAGLAEGAEGRAAASLFFALGELHERDLGDPARALDAYARAEALGAEPLPVWRAIARVSASAGDREGRVRVLRSLVNAGDVAGDGGSLTEDLYDLAELELAAPGGEAAGLASLEWALGRDPRSARAGAMLRSAAEGGDPAVLAMFERVARVASDPAMLLDALARLAAAEGATMDVVREAEALAEAAGDAARVEALLARAIEIGEQNPAGPGDAVWALVALADRRETAGAWVEASRHLSRAIDAAEPDDAAKHAARGVAIALERLQDPALGAEIQERLLARDRHDRAAWEGLLDLHRKASGPAVLEAKLRDAIECAFDVGFRIELRMERARLLVEGRPDDAAVELEEVLQEDAENDEAASLLAKIYERIGRNDALAELMERQLTISRSHSDRDSTLTLSLRLGELWAKDRPEQAIDLYRSALEAAPDSAELLERLLALFASDDRAMDRADVLERLARLAKGRDAAERALSLAELRSRLDDEDGMVRALDLGFRADPSDAALRERLATFYTQRERWAELAALYEFEGAQIQGPPAVARLREAAAIFRDRLDRPADAARALGAAAHIAPDDLGLLVDHARALAAAGSRVEAVAAVSAALDRPPNEADQVTLLRLRAELSTGPDEIERAIADLEIAYGLDPRGAAKDLTLALDRRRATDAGAVDRALTLRLVEVLVAAGDTDRARAVLAEWIARSPDDTVILRKAAEIEGSGGHWDSAVQLCERLVELERGPARVEAALLLAGACAQAGYPLDARPLLEMVWNEDPSDARIREHLRRIYEELHANRELAGLFLAEANLATDPAERFAALRRAGSLFLEPEGDPASAVAPLEAARELRPKDNEVTLLLTDAYIKSNRLQEAANFLDGAIAAQKGRRSREVSMMQHRMAHIARAVGDRSNELAWLNAAFESDAQNGEAAAHLSEVATEFGQLEVAVKALKAITLMKSPKPLTRAQAYYRQALIAQHQGDVRKASMLAKKAHQEDPSLEEAGALVTQLGS